MTTSLNYSELPIPTWKVGVSPALISPIDDSVTSFQHGSAKSENSERDLRGLGSLLGLCLDLNLLNTWAMLTNMLKQQLLFKANWEKLAFCG